MKTKKINIKKILSALLIAGFTLGSCKKKEQVVDDNIYTNPTGSNVSSITTSIVGTVVDKNNNPVIGAIITSGSFTTTTNQDGFFEFQNKLVNKERSYIKVEKAGYFHASRSITPIANSLHKIKVMMLDNTPDGSFDAATGGSVTLTNGAKVDFIASSLVDNQGNVYAGNVNVALEYYNPTEREFSQYMPGNLEAININNEEVGLASLGMLGVELTGTSGQKLQIASGKTATITMPTPYGNAPATIPLWYFDEEIGVWKEDGSATLNGNEYTGEVSHFTIWNVDWPEPTVNICGRIVDNNGQGLSGVELSITRSDNNWFIGSIVTDSAGNYCFPAPQGIQLSADVFVLGGCFSISSIALGPYNSNQTIPSIAISSFSSNNYLSGTVVSVACDSLYNTTVPIYVYDNSFTNLITRDYAIGGNYLVDLCGYTGGVAVICSDNNNNEDTVFVNSISNGLNVADTLKIDLAYACCDSPGLSLRMDVFDTLGNFLFKDSIVVSQSWNYRFVASFPNDSLTQLSTEPCNQGNIWEEVQLASNSSNVYSIYNMQTLRGQYRFEFSTPFVGLPYISTTTVNNGGVYTSTFTNQDVFYLFYGGTFGDLVKVKVTGTLTYQL